MSNGEKKLVYIVLIIIAISSLLLVIKINNKQEYDPELYARVYEEYHSIINTSENEKEVENNINEDMNIENETHNSEEANISNTINNENNDYSNMVSNNQNNATYVNAQNQAYTVEGEIMIPKIKLVYPVINQTTEAYLKIAPTKLAGPNMNEIGNYCIAGHNYRNDQFFSHLSELDINDLVKLNSKNGSKVTYSVYAMYEVNEYDTSCTNQNTNGRIETTLITCTTQKDKRLVVKCRAIT